MRTSKLKRIVSLSLVFCMIFCMLSLGTGGASAAKNDISGHWAESVLRRWINNNQLNGYSDGTIRPDNAVLRGEFCAMANRALRMAGEADIDFSDVPTSHWAYDDVATAVYNEYMIGNSDGTFGVDKPITRQELAVVLTRLFDIDTDRVGTTSDYTDAAAFASWSADAINALAADGTMQGYPDGTFRPLNPVTRAEAVTALDKVLVALGIGSGTADDAEKDEEKEDEKEESTGGGGGGGGGGASTEPEEEKPGTTIKPPVSRPGNPDVFGYLAIDGEPSAQIMIADNATNNEIYAADELKLHVEMVSGASVPIKVGTIKEPATLGEFSAELSPVSIDAVENDYYPVEISLSNPTAGPILVSLVQEDVERGMPKAYFRGDEGLEDGQIFLGVDCKATVYGLVEVENNLNFSTYNLVINAEDEDGTVLDTVSVIVAGRANAIDNYNFDGGEDEFDWFNAEYSENGRAGAGAAAYAQDDPYYEVDLVTGHLYKLTFWARATTNNPNVRVFVDDFDAEGDGLATPRSLYAKIPVGSNWGKYEYHFVANCSEDLAYSYSALGFTGEGSILFDEVALIDCGVAPENRLGNGGFELGSNTLWHPWPYNGGTTLTNSEGYIGEIAGKFTASPGTSGITGGHTPTIYNIGEGEYTVSFWAKADVDGATFSPQMLYGTDPWFAASKTFTLSTEWELYEFNYSVPASQVDTDGQLNTSASTVENDAAIYLDGFALRETSVLDEYVVADDPVPMEIILDDADFDTDMESKWDGVNGVPTDAKSSNIGQGTKSGPYSGTHHVKTGAAGATYQEELYLKGDHLYAIGVQLMMDMLRGNATVTVTDYDEDGNELSMKPLDVTVLQTCSYGYHEFYFIPNAEMSPDYAYSMISFKSSIPASPLWVDDLVLVDCGIASEQYLNGDAEGASGTYLWNDGKNTDPDLSYAGSNSYIIDKGSPNNAGHFFRSTADRALEPGSYRFGFWAMTTDADGADAMAFEWNTTDENGITTSVKDQRREFTSEWQYYSFDFTTYGSYNLTYWDWGPIGSKIYVDNISMMKVTTVEEAREYIDNWDEMTEVDPPEISELPEQPAISVPDAGNVTVLIATPDTYPQLNDMFPEDLEWLEGTDGFAIRKRGNYIYIFGAESAGALNGTYEFIEENLGVVWMRGNDTAYQPKDSLPITVLNYREKSPFLYRGWANIGDGPTNKPQYNLETVTKILYRRNKMNAGFGITNTTPDTPGLIGMYMGHNITASLVTSPTFDPNEMDYWNTDLAGNPIVETDTSVRPTAQVNFWSTKTSDVIADKIIAEALANPNRKVFGLGMNDNNYTRAVGWDDKPFTTMDGVTIYPDDPQYTTTVFWDFMNRVITRVNEVIPDAKISTYAYMFTEMAPACSVHENLIVFFAPTAADVSKPLTTTETNTNEAVLNTVESWKGISKNLAFYDYYFCSISGANYVYGRPSATGIQGNLQYYAENGFFGPFPEAWSDYPDSEDLDPYSDAWALASLTCWLYEKLAWDPYESIEDLTWTFCQAVYGEAAEPMYTFYELQRKGWDESPYKVTFYITAFECVQEFIIKPGLMVDMQNALNKAWAYADDTAKARIQPIKTAFEENLAMSVPEAEEGSFAKRTDAGVDAVLAATDFSDPIWAESDTIENLYCNRYMTFVDGADTIVRLLWDDEYLYVGYENNDATIDDIATTGSYTTGNNWWYGPSDDVETFVTIDPNAIADPNSCQYFAYMNNPSGLHARHKGIGFGHINAITNTWKHTVKVVRDEGADSGHWVVIQAIPWSELGLSGKPVAGETNFYAYFYREYRDGAGDQGYHQISWNGAYVWVPNYLRQFELQN